MTKKDLTGQKFGRLIVLEDTGKRYKNGSVIWKCQCSCEEHNIAEVISGSLISGRTKSCGCLQKEKIRQQGIKNKKDLTGQKFGRLVVLKDSGMRGKRNEVLWTCQCNCDKRSVIEVSTGHLQSGHTKSCGCLRDEILFLHGKHSAKDITGQHFGKLTAISPTNKRTKSGSIIWKCKCDCGHKNIVYVSQSNLKSGQVLSCGCLLSKGESLIKQILDDCKISYETQKTFKDCINPKTNTKLRFDFYLPDYNTCIEYDGIQHFSYKTGNNSWNNKENFEATIERDSFKNKYCKEHNINIIRIPYTDFDKISKTYLLEILNQN